MRSGFLTSASEHGAAAMKMQEVSRHRSLDVLSGYVRRSDLFAAAGARRMAAQVATLRW